MRFDRVDSVELVMLRIVEGNVCGNLSEEFLTFFRCTCAMVVLVVASF